MILRRFFTAILVGILTITTVFSQEKETVIKEQTIYIPFGKLRETFEKEGRGVFLPYEEFRKLWEAAQKDPKEPEPPKPVPVPFMISETAHEAKVADEIVQVTAKLKIDMLKDGWHEIPIRLNDVAITEATLDGKPARLQGNAQQGYKLLIEATKPGLVEVELKYAKTIEKSPGRNGVSVNTPQAPISRWTVEIPEDGVKVDFNPLIAASEVPSDAKITKVQAFVGPAPTVRIGWTPKAEGATGLESLTSVQLEQRVTLDEGVIRTQGILDYTISRAEIDRLAIEVPSDQKVLSIFDPNIRSWSVNQGADAQTVQVELFQPASDRQRVIIGLEKLMEADAKSVNIPTIKAVGAGRQQGVLGVNVSNTLTTETAKTVGLMQMDPAELPQAMRGTGWLYAYRLASATYDLALSVEKVQPQITADSQVVATLNADRLSLSMQTVFTIEKAGVFQLAVDIPDGFDISNVTGIQQGDAQPARVNTWHLADKRAEIGGKLPDTEEWGRRRLTVELSSKAIGKVGLAITLTKRLDDADLKSPTGKSVEINFPMPLAAKEFVIRRDSRAVVNVAEYFRINKVDSTGLQTVPVEQLRGEWRGNLPAAQLGFVLGQTSATLNLTIERRKPHITIRQFQLAQIEDGVAKYTTRFYYTILYSGVKSIRVDVPADISPKFRSRTQGIRDAKVDPSPEGVEEGCIAWEFSRGSEMSGSGMFELYWEEELGQLNVGTPIPVSVPRLVPREVDRAYGHIVITKAQTIDLGDDPDNTGLRPIDPSRDIPEADRIGDAAAAFEFFDKWTLNLIATRYELEEVKRTSIEVGLVRAVMVNNSATLSVQAFYQIKSVQQRMVIAMPEGAKFDIEPTINGNIVTLEKGAEDGQYYIPLSSTNPDQSFLLELRYSQPFGKGGEILIPTFPAEPAVQEMFVAVYVPYDRALWGFNGAWTPLFSVYEGANNPFKRITVNNSPDIFRLIEQMMGMTNTSSQTARPFAVDGHGYLFSTLQPGDSGNAVLKVATIKQGVFYLTALAVFVLFAVGLTMLNWYQRLAGIAFFAVCLLAFNIINPTAAFLLGGFGTDWGFPSELFYVAVLTIIIWVMLACVNCANRKRCECTPLPVEPQENKEGGNSHE